MLCMLESFPDRNIFKTQKCTVKGSVDIVLYSVEAGTVLCEKERTHGERHTGAPTLNGTVGAQKGSTGGQRCD